MPEWTLQCKKTIVCTCRHWIGESVYCPEHRAYEAVISWKEVTVNDGRTAAEAHSSRIHGNAADGR